MKVSGLIRTLVILAVAVAFAPSPAASADRAPNYLPNCLGVPERKPSQLTLACADGGIHASGLRWRGWGHYYAYASGSLAMNDCKPYCAAGHFQPYTVNVIAFGRQTCPNGEIAYAGVRYSYQRIYRVAPWTVAGHTYRVKYGPPQDATNNFPCAPRA